MQRQYQKITLWDKVTPIAVTSSTDATPIVVTASSHGFSNGDRVTIFGHGTNTAANGTFKIYGVTTNTFKLQDEFSGADIAGSGGGAGSNGVVIKAAPLVYLHDFRNAILQFSTSGTATATVKLAGSLGQNDTATTFSQARKDLPNFGATVTTSNPYTFLGVVDLDSGVFAAGSTGIVVAGTDAMAQYEIDINASRYIMPVLISWTQGVISAVLFVTNNI